MIPNSHDVDSAYSEDSNDIDMLHPLFLVGSSMKDEMVRLDYHGRTLSAHS